MDTTEGQAFDPAPTLRAYRTWALRLILVGFVLLFIVSVFNWFGNARVRDLERTGTRYPATVVAVEQDADGGSGSLEVVYAPTAGDERRASISLDGLSPRYVVGQPTTVIVDPEDPGHVTVLGEKNGPWTTMAPFLVGFPLAVVLIPMGVGALFRARRQASVLRRCSWRWRDGAFEWTVFGGRLRFMDEGQDVRLALCWALMWTPQSAGLVGAPGFFVAGDLDGYCVVRAADSHRMVSARPRFRWFIPARCSER